MGPRNLALGRKTEEGAAWPAGSGGSGRRRRGSCGGKGRGRRGAPVGTRDWGRGGLSRHAGGAQGAAAAATVGGGAPVAWGGGGGVREVQ